MPVHHAHAAVHADGNTIDMEIGDTHTITVDDPTAEVTGSDAYITVDTERNPSLNRYTVATTATQPDENGSLPEGKYVFVNRRMGTALESAADGNHTYDSEFDAVCNVCGEEREVKAFTSQQLTGLTGQGRSVDTTEAGKDKSVENAFYGNLDTFWATVQAGTLEEDYLIADLGGEHLINKVEYTKRHDAAAGYNCTGNLLDYIIEVSTDGETWTQVAAGETVDGTTEIEFTPVMASLVKLTATRSYHWQDANANKVMTAAEFAVYKAVCVEHAPMADAVVENEVAATCTTAGSYDMVVYCSVCEEEISRESFTVDALGHDFVDGECSRCHEKEEAPVVNPFEDVPESIYFYEPVLWAVEKNITKGTDDIHFSPNSTVNRAQVVTFLWRAKGSPASSAEISFSDVKYNQYYSIAVAWAIENGITPGLEVGIFGVDAICNRAQAVTFLYRTYSNN